MKLALNIGKKVVHGVVKSASFEIYTPKKGGGFSAKFWNYGTQYWKIWANCQVSNFSH